MPELYERLLDQHATLRKIPIHVFQSAAGEWAAATITGAEAQTIIAAASGGDALGVTGQTEAQDLVATVTGIVVPAKPAALAGNATTAQITTYARQMSDYAAAIAERSRQMSKIDRTLLLADMRSPGYDTPVALRAKLAVPLR